MGHILSIPFSLDEAILDLLVGSYPLLSARSHMVDV